MCLYPRLIKNKKYTVNQKNGGNVPPCLDNRTKYVPVKCGNCMECKKQNAREWQVRLLEDIKTNTNGKFITLTFSNESITQLTNYVREYIDEEIIKLRNRPLYNEKTKQQIAKLQSKKNGYGLDNEIATAAVRLFIERHRKKYGKSIRHWLITELGHNGTENIHLHGIIWTDLPLNEIESYWSYGFMWKGKIENGKLINYVNARTVGYITKYVTKMDIKHQTYKPKILTSPGIGHNYTKTLNSKSNTYNEEQTIETYRTSTGHKISLPIYWRNKIYTEEQREQLWLKKLDRQTRYIMGEKIDISKTDKYYLQILEHYRKINSELGFGNGKINYDQKKYEHEQRILQQQTRYLKSKS